MKDNEWAEVAAGLREAYTRQGFLATNEAMEFWFNMLKDLPGALVKNAAMQYMMSNPFPPTIADIRGAAVQTDDEIQDEEAWGRVRSAISRSTYMFKEEFAKLPPLIQRTLGNPVTLYYMATDQNFNESVEKSLFLRSFAQVKARAKEEAKIPIELREQLKRLQGGDHALLEG